FEMMACLEEPDQWDQWDLPSETASANTGLSLFTTRLVTAGSIVEGMLQPYLYLQYGFGYWNQMPWSGFHSSHLMRDFAQWGAPPLSGLGGLRQPHFLPQFTWRGAPHWSGVSSYSPNPIFGGVYDQECPYSFLYVTCPASVTVTTFTLPGGALSGL